MRIHKPIAAMFGQDMGVKLMRIDSKIALRVLGHFADNHVACLGCHDSFLVPANLKHELFRVMNLFYREELGFVPIVREE